MVWYEGGPAMQCRVGYGDGGGCGWVPSLRSAWLLPCAWASPGWPDSGISCWVPTFLPFLEPASMPTFKGLLEVIIQGPSVQWVRLEGCPCPGQTAGPVLVSAFMNNTTPSFPVPIPPLGCPVLS